MYSYRFLLGVVISILSVLAISVADAARAGWQPGAALADDAPRPAARIAGLDGSGGALDRPDSQFQGGFQGGLQQGGFQQFGGQQFQGGFQGGGFQQFGGQQFQGSFQQFGGQQFQGGFQGGLQQGGFQQFGGQQFQGGFQGLQQLGGGINLQGGFQGGGLQGVPGTRGPRGWEVLGPPPVIVLPPPPSPILIPILPPPAVEPATVVPSAPADGTTPQ